MNKEEIITREFEEGCTAYTLKERLLKDRLFMKMKADLMLDFESTKFRDDEERKEIWRKMQVLGEFDQNLTEIINNGKMAEAELKLLGKLKHKFFK